MMQAPSYGYGKTDVWGPLKGAQIPGTQESICFVTEASVMLRSP